MNRLSARGEMVSESEHVIEMKSRLVFPLATGLFSGRQH